MKNVTDEILGGFVRDCRQAADYGLMRCSSGNYSMRVGNDRMLIKASRSWMARLTSEDVSLCRISDGGLIEGRKPSVEIGFHAGILQARPDVNVVMHFQTPCATTLACHAEAPNYFVIPEIPVYIGAIASVPYLLPGSGALADAVTEAMRSHDLAVLRNHGQVTVGRDADHAIQNAMFFELACEIILRGGSGVVPLAEQDVRAFLQARKVAGAGV
jgi:ribulose-5-phosphate 4-epimerase/fuculose-1-phosphate aldolase